MKKLGLALIQYIVLCDHNPVFVISGLSFEVRFRYLKNLDSCTPLQKSQVQDIKIGRAIADPASGFLDRKRKKSCSCHFYTYM